jgi:hypothetical protein
MLRRMLLTLQVAWDCWKRLGAMEKAGLYEARAARLKEIALL